MMQIIIIFLWPATAGLKNKKYIFSNTKCKARTVFLSTLKMKEVLSVLTLKLPTLSFTAEVIPLFIEQGDLFYTFFDDWPALAGKIINGYIFIILGYLVCLTIGFISVLVGSLLL